MELDGLLRCLEELDSKGVKVKSLTTDRHPTVEAEMRRNYPGLKHRFDTWHVVKGKLN